MSATYPIAEARGKLGELARSERDRALGRHEAPVPHAEARRALLEAAGRGDG
ncbi:MULTISPECIES: hypothetical protein [Streptomyces]|uniref:hypothetical protein n=1 Tax=Streptomyces TaxID=1883 RepID=UPI0036D1650F